MFCWEPWTSLDIHEIIASRYISRVVLYTEYIYEFALRKVLFHCGHEWMFLTTVGLVFSRDRFWMESIKRCEFFLFIRKKVKVAFYCQHPFSFLRHIARVSIKHLDSVKQIYKYTDTIFNTYTHTIGIFQTKTYTSFKRIRSI